MRELVRCVGTRKQLIAVAERDTAHSGLTDAEATTIELDSLYDSMDLDGSGNLDIGEMKEALKGLQSDLKGVRQQNKRRLEYVADLRAVAALYQASIEDAEGYQIAKLQAERMKRAAAPNSPAMGLATLFKKKNLDVLQVVESWDDDGGGSVDSDEFATKVRQLGLEGTDAELLDLFQLLDDDNSGELEISELLTAMQWVLKMTSSLKEAKAAEKTSSAVTSKKKKAAEASQMTAFEASLAAEAKNRAAEQAAKFAANLKAKEAAAKKVEERAAKKEQLAKIQRDASVPKFMSS